MNQIEKEKFSNLQFHFMFHVSELNSPFHKKNICTLYTPISERSVDNCYLLTFTGEVHAKGLCFCSVKVPGDKTLWFSTSSFKSAALSYAITL